MRGAVAEVQTHVLGSQGHGPLRRIDRADLPGAAREGIDRKTARVAERVEHGAPLGVAFHQFAVFALVEEEPGFLPLFPVDHELLAVFEHDVRRMVGGAPQIAVDGSEVGLVGERLRRLVVDGRNAVAVGGADGFGDFAPCAVHAHRMALDHGRGAVDVDHEPRQRVAFAVDQAVAGGPGVVREAQRAAHVVGDGHAAVPPSLVDRLALERQHAHGDRADLVVALGDEVARTGEDLDQSALGDLGFLLGLDAVDGARKDPGMAPGERLLLALAQVDLRYHERNFLIFGVRSSFS